MTTATDHASRLNIEAFYRMGADGRSTSFDTLHYPDRLMGQLRDQGVCGTAEASPVVILTEPDDQPGNCQGTVAVANDDHYLETIDRAIRCLEAVRAGLLEAGHSDD